MNVPILLDCHGPVAYLTLNRPEAGNAVDAPFARCLLERVKAVAEDPAIGCVVIRGNGRMFCAGGDVKALHAAGEVLPDLLREILESLHPAIELLCGMDKPLIAAIHGPAAGVGLGLTAAADIALAEPKAHFTMAYSRIGLTPDGGTSWLIPRLIGLRRAQELSLTNRRVTAHEAAEMGLITRVVAEGTLPQETEALAQMLATKVPGALGRTKELLHSSSTFTLGQQLKSEIQAIEKQAQCAEARAAIADLVLRR